MKNNRFHSITQSRLLRRGLLVILFVACIALLSLSGSRRVSSQTSNPTPPPQARNEAKPVSLLVDNAKRAGRNFPLAEPFDPQTRSAAADATQRRAVKAGTVLQLRQNALADLVNRNEQSLTLRLPTFGGPPVELELVQINLFAPNFRVTTSSSQGAPVAVEPGVHYWGTVKGAEGSLAAMSIFKNEVIGFYSSQRDGNFVLGKLGGNNPRRDHILYAEKDLTGTIPVDCDMPDDNAAYSPDQLDAESTASVFRCVKVFLEADFDLFQNKGSVGETNNYVIGVFNQSAALYNNEGIPISISEIFVWDTPSPYNGGDSQTQLMQFQNTRTSFNGDVAHLVDLQNQGGIAAGFNGFCNPNRSQSECYSGIFPFFENVPTYSWTVYVFTHEMGHLFGSRHTHACVWNGNGTAIDGCSGATEGGCSLPGIPPEGGTIMSYCHLQSIGINFSLGFGPQPGNVIHNAFNGAGCLGTCGDPGGGTYTAAFQSIGGYYVVAEGGGGDVVNANRTAIGAWETFTVIDQGGGALESGDLINIQSVGGYFVVAEGGGGDVVNCNRTVPQAWETFRIEKIGGGGVIGSGDSISLQAYNGWSCCGGNYVVAEDGGGSVVNANRGAVGAWETFTIHIF
jgi:metallopeptidase family M12-like protein